jgi:hypothetical protein
MAGRVEAEPALRAEPGRRAFRYMEEAVALGAHEARTVQPQETP